MDEGLSEFVAAALHQHARERELVPRDPSGRDEAFAQAIAFQIASGEDDESMVEVNALDGRAEIDLKVAASFLGGDLTENLREGNGIERADPLHAGGHPFEVRCCHDWRLF